MENNEVSGVVSDRDILKTISPFVGNRLMERTQDLSCLRKRVHQIMSRTPVTVRADESIAEAAKKVLRKKVSCLPVVDEDGSLLGIVTIRDFVSWAAGFSAVEQGRPKEVDQDSQRTHVP